MKLDPSIHIAMHSVLSLKPGVTGIGRIEVLLLLLVAGARDLEELAVGILGDGDGRSSRSVLQSPVRASLGAGLAVLAPGPSASGRRLLGRRWRIASGRRLLGRQWRIGCRSSLVAEMADVLGRPFTRLHRLAVSPPLRSPLCGLRRWCRWRVLPWLRRTAVAGIEEEADPGTWSGVCNFQFSKGLLCKRAEMYYSLTV